MGWKMWSRFVVFQMFDRRSHKFVLKFILDYILISMPSYVTDFVTRPSTSGRSWYETTLEAKTLRTVSHPGEPSTVPQVGPAASHQTSVVPHVRGKPFKMLYGCVFTGFCKRRNPASPVVQNPFVIFHV